MAEAGHAVQPAKILAAPADKITLGVVILQLQADAQPLDLGPAVVQVLFVSVDHARGDDFAASEHLGHDAGQLFRLAAEAPQKEGLGVWGLGQPPSGAPEPEGSEAAPASPEGAAAPTPQTLVGGVDASQCHPSYDPCLPVVDDLDCGEVRAMVDLPVQVKGPDDYNLDADGDGTACETGY